MRNLNLYLKIANDASTKFISPDFTILDALKAQAKHTIKF